MEFRRHHPQRTAAAKAGFSERTSRRIETDQHAPSRQTVDRRVRRQGLDPFDGLWEREILPMLDGRPGLRPIALLEEMERRHPDRGIAAAFGVPSCCALPLLLTTLGVGSAAWLGGIALLAAQNRPILLGAAALCLLGGAVLLWRERKAVTVCSPSAICSRPTASLP